MMEHAAATDDAPTGMRGGLRPERNGRAGRPGLQQASRVRQGSRRDDDRSGPHSVSDRRRRRSFEFGVSAERSVGQFLRAGGYDVLGSRERTRAAEVDLIALRDDTVVFVEVKARRCGWDGLASVDERKQRRICRAANEWVGANPRFAQHTIRFDIALVWQGGRIEYLENAFEEVMSDDFVW